MTQYARVADGVVAELFTPPDGVPLADCFHPDIAAQFVAVPDATLPAPGWTYDGVTFAAPAPPSLTWEQLLGGKVAGGIAITSTGSPALNATYALDATTLEQIGSVARDAAAGLGLPGDAAHFTYPDAAGAPHSFTEPQIIALYKAMRDLLLQLNTQAAVMAHGGPPNWPSQSKTIA